MVLVFFKGSTATGPLKAGTALFLAVRFLDPHMIILWSGAGTISYANATFPTVYLRPDASAGEFAASLGGLEDALRLNPRRD